jgi:hypothetical protein
MTIRSGPTAACIRLLLVTGCIALGPFVHAANHHLTYYGVENDPDKSRSANDSAAAAAMASGSSDKLPVAQSRTGEQMLQDLDKLVQDHGDDGKLKPGVFVFHYSGHGNAVPGGPALIGLPTGLIDTDQLVDKLIEIAGEDTKVLILIDSCGAGNLKNSLRSKVGNEDGKRMTYFAVMGTREFEEGEVVCPRQGPVDIGSRVKDGLSKGDDGFAKADKDKDGKVSVKELGEYAQEEGDGFSSDFQTFDFEGEPSMIDTPVTGTELVNGVIPPREPADKTKAGIPPPALGTESSLHYDAGSQVLSFSGHLIADTGFADDPLLGAEVLLPDLTLLGELDPLKYLFTASSPFLGVTKDDEVLLTGMLSQLVYNAATNDFVGEITDPVLATSGAGWLEEAGAWLDPFSPRFDPAVALFFSFRPTDSFLTLTQNFGAPGTFSGSPAIFVAPIREPHTALLLAAALCWLMAVRRGFGRGTRGALSIR